MKITQIMPGYLQTYYCENCLRDNSLVRAFRDLGHDLLIVPLYMPAQINTSQRQTEIFMGGINVYLQQKSSLFQKTPRWLDKIFDAPWLLKKVTQKQSMTRAQDLGELTLSMLQGEQGRQHKELHRLVNWLKHHEQPDIIALSNALLLGLAPSLKKQLSVPIVCMLQDEDAFLDAMPQPHHQKILKVMIEQANAVDLFIANSDRYANTMQSRLQLNPQKITTIHTALNLEDYPENKSLPKIPTIGFLSCVTKEKGLDLLIDAFLQLKTNPNLKNLRLKISGDQMSRSNHWLNHIHHRLKNQNVDFIKKFDLPDRLDFFRSLSLLCVPDNQGESSGLNALEAQAMSRPVVQPDTHEFPEQLKNSPGSVLFKPNNAQSLTEAMLPLLTNPTSAREMGQKARQHITQHFNIKQSAQKWIQNFQGLLHD